MDGNKRLSESGRLSGPASIPRENSSEKSPGIKFPCIEFSVRLYTLLITFLRFIPPTLLLRLLSLIGSSLPLFLRRDARIAEAQLAGLLFKLDENHALIRTRLIKKIVRQSFASTAVSLGETLLASKYLDRMKFHECIEGSSIPWERQKAGSGAIALSAHLGPWEVLAAYHARNYPDAFKVVGKTPNYAPLQTLLNRLRLENGVETIWRSDKSAAIDILRSLKKNEIIGFLIDQDTTVPSLFAPFFGVECAHPSAPLEIAIKRGLPIYTTFIVRRGFFNYDVMVEEISYERGKDSVATEILAIYSRRLENLVRQHPEQWVWWHRRWRRRPNIDYTENPEMLMSTSRYIEWIGEHN